MTSRADNKRWLLQLRKGWLPLAQAAVWVGGILGGFLLPPPVGVTAADERTWLRFGQFVTAIVLGLVLFAAWRWHQTRHAPWWAGVALLSLALAGGAFFRYQQLTLAWTGEYVGNKVVVGSVYTPHGQSYVEKNPSLSRNDLIFDFAGKIEEIWTRDSINRRRLLLAATYVACLPLFTICLIAVVQTAQCVGRKSEAKSGN
jgi:hypothetical protein